MKITRHIILLLISTVFFAEITCAQEEQAGNSGEDALHQKISVLFSHSYIPAKNEATGEKKTFIAASLGLNYELWLNSRWAIGLHNDVIMQSFNTEIKANGSSARKEFPILTSLVGIYKPWKHWAFFAGPGKEFEKAENFYVIKTGVEYELELQRDWEVAFGADYDIKIGGYNSWVLGIGITRVFIRK